MLTNVCKCIWTLTFYMCIELQGENDDEEEHGWEDELCSHYDQESQLVAELQMCIRDRRSTVFEFHKMTLYL